MIRPAKISIWYLAGIFCLGGALGINLTLSWPAWVGILRWGLLLAAALLLVVHAGTVARAGAEPEAERAPGPEDEA